MRVHEPYPSTDLLSVLASLLTDVPLVGPVAVGLRVLGPASATCSPRAGVVPIADRELELHFRHLDSADAVCALGGFVAPADWHAFGVVAPAHSYRLDDDGAPQADHAVAVVACALVDRSGHVVAEVRAESGDLLSDGATEGRVVDACRRVLGLPTAAALSHPRVWASVCWVDAALAATLAADLGAPPSWAQLRALDPFTGRGLRIDWPALRHACAAEVIEVPGVAPGAAAWMDDGMFAREALGALPPLVEMLGDLRELLEPEVFALVLDRVCARLAA